MTLNPAFSLSAAAIGGIALGYSLGASFRTGEAGPQIPNSLVKNPSSEVGSRNPDAWEIHGDKAPMQITTRSTGSREEVETVMNGLKNIRNMEERRRRFREVTKAWAESDVQAALKFALELSDSGAFLKADAIVTVARVLAVQNPAYLKRLVQEMPQDANRQTFILELARQGVGIDIDQTLAWAETLPRDRSRSEALRFLHTELARRNPEQAAKVFDQMEKGFARLNLAGVIAMEWGMSDPRAAAQWAVSLATSEREAVIPALAASWSQADPQAAGEFVANLSSGETQDRAAMSVMANWAGQNPQAAADWAMKFPEGRLRDLGVREVVNSWTSMDPDRAFEWVKQIPGGNTRDFALGTYAESAGYWSPDKAVTVTNLIQDEVQREAAIESVIRSWSEVDSDAAKRWLSNQTFRIGLQNRLSGLFVLPAE